MAKSFGDYLAGAGYFCLGCAGGQHQFIFLASDIDGSASFGSIC